MVPGVDIETVAASAPSPERVSPPTPAASSSSARVEKRRRRPPTPIASAPDRQLVERIVRILRCDHQTREMLVGLAKPRSDADTDVVLAAMDAAPRISKAATWVVESAADDPMSLGVRATDLAISGDFVNDVVAVLRQLGALPNVRQPAAAAKVGLQIAKAVASLEPQETKRLKTLVATLA